MNMTTFPNFSSRKPIGRSSSFVENMTMISEITTAQKGSFAPLPGNGLGLAIVKFIVEQQRQNYKL
ncbi:MAG: hypothetical protein L0287_22100 [Anaerolineae bacterium]|nr:hypothetical protein [Anaerolineae bacterium]